MISIAKEKPDDGWSSSIFLRVRDWLVGDFHLSSNKLWTSDAAHHSAAPARGADGNVASETAARGISSNDCSHSHDDTMRSIAGETGERVDDDPSSRLVHHQRDLRAADFHLILNKPSTDAVPGAD